MTAPLGITLSLDGVQATEQGLRRVAGGVDAVGVSAKQTAAALRGVPAQFTDIVTSLASGQAPLTVFLQQGGQLKDMFGGAGNAAKALGGYVVGLVNPFTVAAAAGVALALAYKQGSAEADAYARSIALTGNAAGVTTSQLQGMAERVSAVVGTQSKAAEVVAQLVGTGSIASQNLEQFTATAIRLERNAGVAVKDTVKEFAELGKEPVEAAKKLNERYNYLTAAVYEQIKALQEQGKASEAAALSQQSYDKAMTTVASTLEGRLGYLERAWRGVGDGAKWAWDQMLNVGRPSTAKDAADEVRSRLSRQLQELADKRAINPNADTSGLEKGIEVLRQRLGVMESDERMLRRAADAQAARTQAERDAIVASDELQKIQAKGLTQRQQMNKELEKYRQNLEKERAVNPGSATLTPEAIARGERAIRDQFKDQAGASTGESELATIKAKITETEKYIEALRTQGLEGAKLNDGERMALKIKEELKTSITGTARANKELALVEAEKLGLVQRAAAAEEQRQKAVKKSTDEYAKLVESTFKAADALQDQADKQQAANAVYGKGAAAIDELALTTLKSRMAEAQASDSFSEKYIAALEAQIQAQERLNAARAEGRFKEMNESLDRELAAANQQAALYQDELRLTGLSALERAKIVALRQSELELARDLEKIEQGGFKDAEKEQLRIVAREKQRVAGSAAVNKVIQDDFTRTSETIERSLTDALLRGFESGKGFAKNLRDTVVNMFKTLVLRPIISAIINPVAGAITGALGLAGTASAATAAASGGSILGSAGGILSGVGALAGNFGAGLTTGFSGLMAGNLGSTLGLGTGLIGSGATAGGIGTIVGALGPIALGIGALVAISKATKGETRTGGQFGVSFDGTVTNQRRDQVYTYQGQQFDRDFSNGQRNALIAGQAYRLEGDPVQNEQAIRDAVSGTASGINAFLKALGSKATLTGFSAGLETSSKGRGGVFAGGILSDGTTFGESGKGDNYAGTLYEKFSTNSPDFKTALENFTLDLKQSTIQALQSVTDIPETVKKMLKGVDAEGLSEEAANALLESINAQIVGVQNLTSAFEAMGLDKLAEMGFDAAAGLAAAAGGFDKLQTNLNTYYDNFYTDEEKRANLQKQVDKQFAELGIDVPKNRDEFRRLVEGTLEQVDVQDKARASLSKQINDAIAGAGKDGFTLADAGGRSLVSTINPALLGNGPADPALAGKLNGFLAGVSDLAAKGLDPEAFDKGLAGLIDVNAEVLGIGKDASKTAATLLALSGTFAQLNESADDAAARIAKEQADARDKALRGLERAIDAEKKALQSQIDVAREVADTMSGLFDLLKTNVQELYGEVDSTRAMLAVQGNDFITQALATARTTGYLPDQTQLADAISAARGGLDSAGYASQFELDRDRLVLAGKLSELEGLTGKQLTSAERTVKELEAQSDQLDKTLDYWKQQIDIANGTYEATLSVTEAIKDLEALMFPKASSASSASGSGRAGGPTGAGGTAFGPGANTSTKYQTPVGGYTGGTIYAGVSLDQERRLDKYAAGYHAFDGTGDAEGLNKWIADNKLTPEDLAGLSGLYESDWERWYKANNIPAFAVGTNYVPRDMLAQIHEGEAIVPKAYNPAANPGMSGGGQTEALLAALLEQNARLETRLAAIEGHTQDTSRATNGNPISPVPMALVEDETV